MQTHNTQSPALRIIPCHPIIALLEEGRGIFVTRNEPISSSISRVLCRAERAMPNINSSKGGVTRLQYKESSAFPYVASVPLVSQTFHWSTHLVISHQ